MRGGGVADDMRLLTKCMQQCGAQSPHCIHGLSAFTSKLGKSVTQPATPAGCPSCLLRMSMRMEKKDQVDRREERDCRGWWISTGKEECP